MFLLNKIFLKKENSELSLVLLFLYTPYVCFSLLYSFRSILLSSRHFVCSFCNLFKVPPASVYFLKLCCSFLFRYSPAVLLTIHKPAPMPLAIGTLTSPTPVTLNVIHVEETPNTRTESFD